jgi:hypothetical protein
MSHREAAHRLCRKDFLTPGNNFEMAFQALPKQRLARYRAVSSSAVHHSETQCFSQLAALRPWNFQREARES